MNLLSSLLALVKKSNKAGLNVVNPTAKEPTLSRKDLLFSLFNSKGIGLEIGPSFNPLLPKSQGFKVDILDHLTDVELKVKYANAPNVSLESIEKVDFVSTGGSIYDLIGKAQHYDFIVASHVIEHTTDLLGFLIDCERLLKPDGVLVLAVPDKRFSFDCLRPTSTAGQVLQGHLEGCQIHNPGKVFDELAYNCLRAGAVAWPKDSIGNLDFFTTLEHAKNAFNELSINNSFRDIHAWQFTPSGFRMVLSDLIKIGAISLGEKNFINSNTGEFYVALSKSADSCSIPRLALAQQSIFEERSINVMH